MNKVLLAALIAGLVWLGIKSKAGASPGVGDTPGGGDSGGINTGHPKFKVGDIVTDGYPSSDYYQMKITVYNPSPADRYGTYNLEFLTGAQKGWVTGWFVDQADNYFHKL